jgi:hypothetical protein
MTPTYPWHDLLTRWSTQLIALNREPQLWVPNAVTSRWLGHAGATEDQLQTAEARLKATLPPSYRTFLATSNGWSVLTPCVWRVFSLEDIDWYGPRHPENIALLRGDFGANPIGAFAQLFGRDTEARASDEDEIPAAQLQSALAIAGGSDTDAVEYVLTPQLQTTHGEWEAWIIRWWKPTTMERYPSFWHLMQAEFQRLDAGTT